MRTEKAMTRDVVCIGPEDSIADAYEIMTEWEIRHLPVLDRGKLVGILSDRDALIHAVKVEEDQLKFEGVSVADAMTINPIKCRRNTEISTLCELMIRHKIDSIPIVEDDELVGLVTSTDLLQVLFELQEVGARRPIPFQFHVYSSTRPGQYKKAARF